MSLEAVDRTYEIVLGNSGFFPLHLDNCVPWFQLLDDDPLPAWLIADWEDTRSRVADSLPFYVAVTPTGTDRRTIAPACGVDENSPVTAPPQLLNAAYDSPLFKEIYLRYVEHVIDFFQPQHLNLGIEISELALNHPSEWPAYAGLYGATYASVKQNHPTIKVGLELVMQSLLAPAVANLVKPSVELSDYICISFYPYGSEAGVAQGAPALPTPPDQWRQPLDWLRTYTTKPLAVCETGYATKSFTLGVNGFEVNFEGDPDTQYDFLEDLVRYAKRDRYLFVIWFSAVDYTKLIEAIPDAPAFFGIWETIGLFDADVQPKRAWELWPGPETGYLSMHWIQLLLD